MVVSAERSDLWMFDDCLFFYESFAKTLQTIQRMSSSSRTDFMNKNSGRIKALSWYLIIVY